MLACQKGGYICWKNGIWSRSLCITYVFPTNHQGSTEQRKNYRVKGPYPADHHLPWYKATWAISSASPRRIQRTRHKSMQPALATHTQCLATMYPSLLSRIRIEWEVCPTLPHMTSNGNRTPGPLDLGACALSTCSPICGDCLSHSYQCFHLGLLSAAVLNHHGWINIHKHISSVRRQRGQSIYLKQWPVRSFYLQTDGLLHKSISWLTVVECRQLHTSLDLIKDWFDLRAIVMTSEGGVKFYTSLIVSKDSFSFVGSCYVHLTRNAYFTPFDTD